MNPEPVVSSNTADRRSPRRNVGPTTVEREVLVPASHDVALVDSLADVDWDSALPDWAGTTRWRVWRAAKRVLDIVVSAVALVVLVPVFVLIAIAIAIDSRGSILHPMEWVGLRGRRFHGYKFRTMVRDAEARKLELMRFNEMTGPAFKMRDDPRITRVGRFLRRWSLDELPQFWNVLTGDLSLVGPRAMRPHEFAQFKPWQRYKAAVVPGLTCIWQVSGRNLISSFDEWSRLDLEYIAKWSFAYDLRLLLATIPAVISGRGAH